MNRAQFNKLKNEDPDFEKNHCFMVDPKDLVYDKNTSQIRKNGHVTSNFKDYGELIKKGTSFPPISLRKLPNNKYALMEGCTRAGGAELVNRPILATVYMDQVLNFTNSQWEDWQACGNDHDNSSPNTTSDIESFIDRQCKNGNLSKKLGFTYDNNEKKYVEAAAKHYRHDIYPNSGKDLDFFRRKVKKALAGQVSGYYENYSTAQAFKFYAAATGFQGSGVGDISGGRVVYTFSKPNHKTPATIGHIASKVMDNPDVKVSLVYHVGELVGKNDDKILKERKGVEDWFDKVKAFHGWLDDLNFLPQIKQGENKENLYKLIKSR